MLTISDKCYQKGLLMKPEKKRDKKIRKTIKALVEMDLEPHNEPYPNTEHEPKQYIKEKVKA